MSVIIVKKLLVVVQVEERKHKFCKRRSASSCSSKSLLARHSLSGILTPSLRNLKNDVKWTTATTGCTSVSGGKGTTTSWVDGGRPS